jgi:hypothetical protein
MTGRKLLNMTTVFHDISKGMKSTAEVNSNLNNVIVIAYYLKKQ